MQQNTSSNKLEGTWSIHSLWLASYRRGERRAVAFADDHGRTAKEMRRPQNRAKVLHHPEQGHASQLARQARSRIMTKTTNLGVVDLVEREDDGLPARCGERFRSTTKC